MEEQQNELLTHTIYLDEFLTVEWKIPKVITPLQLKAMTYKINKLFNISEVPIAEDKPEAQPQHQPLSIKHNGKYNTKYTPELNQKIIEMYNSGKKTNEISKTLFEMTNNPYFLEQKKVYQRINYMKEIGQFNDTPKKRNRSQWSQGEKFTPEDVTKIIEIYTSGIIFPKQIALKLNLETSKNFTHKQLTDKIQYMKKTGLIKNG